MIAKNNNNKDYDYDLADNFNKLAGGNTKKWKNVDQLEANIEEYILQSGISMEEYLNVIKQKIDRTKFPITLNPETATFDDVAIHGILRQRLGPTTVAKNIRYAKFMESHIVPVNFRKPSYENFIKHMDYREQFEFEDGKGYSALTHEWKTMQMFLKAYGIKKDDWPYKPPSFPLYRAKVVPLPEQVNKIIQLQYSTDPYENALIQYMLCHNFVIGWRIPSEPFEMTTDDIKIYGKDKGFVKITEPKKHESTRTVTPTEIMTRKQVKSFKNWLDYWRPKVVNQYSGNALYLRPDGRPFASKEQLRMYLDRKTKPFIKEIFPEYHNYIARDFCAIARLIRTKLDSKHFDIYEVKEWLGHTQIQTTMTYIKDAKQYFKLAPFDWINKTLKATRGESLKNSTKAKKRAC